MHRLLSVLVVTTLLVGGIVGARTARAATPRAAANLCPVFVGRIDKLDAGGTQYAIGLVTYGGTGTASGSLALYSNDLRYEVPFTGIRAINPSDPRPKPQPLVVRFTQSVTIDGAVVDALGTPARQCTTPYQPWTNNGALAPVIGSEVVARAGSGSDAGTLAQQIAQSDVFDEQTLWRTFDAAAARATPVDAGTAALATTACESNANARATMPHAGEVAIPAAFLGRTVVIDALVTIGSDGKLVRSALVGTSGDRHLDLNVLGALQHSSFTAGQFRCAPTAGTYVFAVVVNT